MLKGKDIIISRWNGSAYEAFAASKSCTVEVGSATIEISSATTGEWRDYIAARKDWTVSTTFLVVNAAQANDSLLAVGTKYWISIITNRSAGIRLEGSAILKKAKISSTVGSLVQGSFSFVGCGSLALA